MNEREWVRSPSSVLVDKVYGYIEGINGRGKFARAVQDTLLGSSDGIRGRVKEFNHLDGEGRVVHTLLGNSRIGDIHTFKVSIQMVQDVRRRTYRGSIMTKTQAQKMIKCSHQNRLQCLANLCRLVGFATACG